jgi:hypothetical protein
LKPRESWTGYYCNKCNEISRIVKLYGEAEVLDILRTTCIRNKKQINNKIEIVKKEQEEVEPPCTRSKKKVQKEI